ncbi:hypothetical protein DVS28_b0375 (plasmid) [Euzebya pacifica]|uniref:Uncharacterized protein n=1 Tax=Euzebya pacifica TaxID=1608957 RepID=A0A346Y6P8_9ACTN|nr:hypothetical protein [Euzebya pacifica]AXV10145.1 hypothetical protein DVS28_b0375 [Euzebya pacifica]
MTADTKAFYVDDHAGTAAVLRADTPRIAQQWMAAETDSAPADWVARRVDEDRARYIAAALRDGTWHGWPAGGSAQDSRAFWLDVEEAVTPVAASVIPTVRAGLIALDGRGDLHGWQVPA